MRIFTTFGTCSTKAGHASMQAPQVVQAHRVSGAMTAPTSGRSMIARSASVRSAFSRSASAFGNAGTAFDAFSLSAASAAFRSWAAASFCRR